MPDTSGRLDLLLRRFADDQATEAEITEMTHLLSSEGGQEILDRFLDNLQPEIGEEKAAGLDREALWQKIKRGKDIPVRRLDWKRWVVAASVILALGLGGYVVFVNKKENKSTEPVAVVPTDVEAPKVTKATITLADGKIVSVDSLTVLTQSDVQLQKTADGKIVYSGSAGQMIYNTLTNPRGSQVIDITLSDGSRVWLNAGSFVTYPVAFTGNDRKVSISGEAYFEVTRDASKPFYVTKDDMAVQVLGTHFNVNAYDDEPDIKVTLLEGSVRVARGQNSLIIKPNQQAVIAGNAAPSLNAEVDVAEVMAWKNGRFVFGEKADIQTIMRQVARWYDVDVEYNGTFTRHFGGSISRQVNVSELLRVLEATGGVKGTVEGRKVIVMPVSP